MLSQKPWTEIAAVRFVALLLVLIFAAIKAGQAWWLLGSRKPGADADYWKILFGTIAQDGCILIATFVFLHWENIRWSEAFGFSMPGNGTTLVVALLVGTIALGIAMALQSVSSELLRRLQVEGGPQQVVEILQAPRPLAQQFGLGIITVALAPLSEEILFRGILYPTIKQSGYPRLALWGTSLLFATIHFNLTAFLPLTFLALIWTWLYEIRNNLLAPILAHSLFNTFNFLMALNEPLFRELMRPLLHRLERGGL